MSLECATCLEAFESTGEREPRSLPLCGHSLCLSCLRVVLTKGRQCPTCRTPFGAENNTEARFPKNFALLPLLEAPKAGKGEGDLESREKELQEELRELLAAKQLAKERAVADAKAQQEREARAEGLYLASNTPIGKMARAYALQQARSMEGFHQDGDGSDLTEGQMVLRVATSTPSPILMAMNAAVYRQMAMIKAYEDREQYGQDEEHEDGDM